MILVQCVLEWAVVCRSAGLLVVGIRIVEIVFIAVMLLLAVDSPDCDSNTTEQDSTTNAAYNATNYALR